MAAEIISKRCSTCKQYKQLSEFSKDRSRKDGFKNDCKTCDRAYRQSEKGKTVHRRANKKYQKTPKAKVAHKHYRQSEKGKAFYRKHAHRYRIGHPERINARKAVNEAIKVGKLPRPDSLQCSCGEQAEAYHHHKGYEQEHWLDVVPVCILCHTLLKAS